MSRSEHRAKNVEKQEEEPMTEAEWLTSTDPQAMLVWLTAQVALSSDRPRIHERYPGDRKLRLFACACRRFVGDFDWTPAPSDGVPTWGDMEEHPEREIRANGLPHGDLIPAIEHAQLFVRETRPVPPGSSFSLALAAVILRDIAGNPFRPHVGLCGRIWAPPDSGTPHRGCRECNRFHTPTVLSLAQAAYDQRQLDGTLDPVRLAILADALEEAGMPDDHPNPLLAHLRSCGPHVRGCWALDIVLGKTP